VRLGRTIAPAPSVRRHSDEDSMRTLARLSFVPLVVAGIAGCGGATATATPLSSPNPTPTATPAASPTPVYAIDTSPDKLVVGISPEGGFINPAGLLTRLPDFALYGDGRALTVATDPNAIGLLPDVRQAQLTPTEVQKVVALADADGLLGADATYDSPGNPDSGATLFTAVVGSKVHTIRASGLTAGAGGDASSPQAKLVDFETKMANLASFLGRNVDDITYAPSAVRVFASSAGDAGSGQSAPPTIAWPLSADPSAGSPTTVDGVICTLVSGPDLTAFLAAAATASSDTVWTAPSGRYALTARPLYPDETGC
jgi:hypothetical protein